MATGNFKSMDDFPLLVAEDEYFKICPDCGCGQDPDKETCEICGADMTGEEEIYNDEIMKERVRDMERAAEAMNAAQAFYEVTVESGYYSGLQFYVEDKYWKVENFTNDEAQDEFGVCRSEMLRRYKVAGNTVRRMLNKAKDDLGLMELGIVARFSNGETIYSQVA